MLVVKYSRPSQYRRSRDWRKGRGIRKLAVIGVIYNQEKPYLGLEDGRQYWGRRWTEGRYWGGGGGRLFYHDQSSVNWWQQTKHVVLNMWSEHLVILSLKCFRTKSMKKRENKKKINVKYLVFVMCFDLPYVITCKPCLLPTSPTSIIIWELHDNIVVKALLVKFTWQ